MSARYVKIILWVVALYGAWKLGQSYAVTNALFLFAAGGVVPGTNTVLTPNQVFWLLGILLGVALLLIFGSNLRRTFLFWFGRRPAEAKEADVAAPVPATVSKKRKAGKPQPIVVIELPKQPSLASRALRRIAGALATAFAAVAAKAHTHFPRFVAVAANNWLRVQRIAQSTWEFYLPYLRRARHAARAAFIRLAIAVALQAIRLWHWAEPHLREFDRWLGVQYHRGQAEARKNEVVKAIINLTAETNKIVANWRAEIRAAFTRAVEK